MMASLTSDLHRLLVRAGCTKIREGSKHEIWLSPINARSFSVPRTVKSSHTANEILKQAGLPKAF